MVFSLTMLPPVGVSLYYGDGDPAAFLAAFAWLLAVGAAVWWPARRDRRDLRLRDGFVVVTLFWTVLGIGGGIAAVHFAAAGHRADRRGLRGRVRPHDHRRDHPGGSRRAAPLHPVLPAAAAVAGRHGHRDPRGGVAADARRRRHVALSRGDAGSGQGHEAHAAHHAVGTHAVGRLRRQLRRPARRAYSSLACPRSTRSATHSRRSRSAASRTTTRASATSTAGPSRWSRCSSCWSAR